MDNTELENVKSAIVQNCRHFWNERRKAYLLSKVGMDLPGVGPYIRNATGKRLRDYIETELNDKLRIERWSRAKNISGLFPRDAVLTDDIDSYFVFETPKPRPEEQTPRYNPSFWAAFVVPLQPGYRRYISLAYPTRFEDVPGDSEEIEGRLEIDGDLIVSPSDPNRDKTALANIQTWLERHKIDGSSLLMKSRAELAHQGLARSDTGRSLAPTELDFLIEAVGYRDLARITLPLDIVARLLGKRRLK